MLTPEQRQARAFRYLFTGPGHFVIQQEDGQCSAAYIAFGMRQCTGVGPDRLHAIEACVAKIRASFDPQWGMDCEPTAPDASLEGVPHGD